MGDIKEGQIWSYKSRNSEEESRLTVIKIDNLNKGAIVHIRIDGLKLIKKKSGEVIETAIEHLPISLEMFKKSVCKVESVVKTPTNEGYLYWKELYDQGKAGVWAVKFGRAGECNLNCVSN